jgi:hypothetical protein
MKFIKIERFPDTGYIKSASYDFHIEKLGKLPKPISFLLQIFVVVAFVITFIPLILYMYIYLIIDHKKVFDAKVEKLSDFIGGV